MTDLITRHDLKPWHGGNRAPDDWDGGEVLLGNGEWGDGNVWDHHPSRDTHIIAYRARAASEESLASALDRIGKVVRALPWPKPRYAALATEPHQHGAGNGGEA